MRLADVVFLEVGYVVESWIVELECLTEDDNEHARGPSKRTPALTSFQLPSFLESESRAVTGGIGIGHLSEEILGNRQTISETNRPDNAGETGGEQLGRHE